MITIDEIRTLLTSHHIVPVRYEELGEDTPITLDSLALVWLLHQLEEDHGITADPRDEDLEQFTSVRGIHRYLAGLPTGKAAGTLQPDGEVRGA